MLAQLRHYWTREAGFGEALSMIAPIVISTLSWTIMQFIDRMYLAWYSPQALAASLPGAVLHFAVICFFLGVASYVNTFVAQYYGADRPDRVGPSVWQGLYLALFATPLFALTLPLAPYVFEWSAAGTGLAGLETRYYQILTVAAPAMVIAAAQQAFFTGRGDANTVAVIDLIAAGINIVLDYAWVFGRWGFPEGGIDGAAWATVVALWFRPLAYAGLMFRPRFVAQYGLLSGWRFDPELFARLLRYGAPAGVTMFLEMACIAAFTLLVGRMGQQALEATTLAFNVNGLAFMPVYGCGIAAAAMVGRRLGENQPHLAERAVWSTFWLGAVYVLAVGSLYWFAPRMFLALHEAGIGNDPARVAEFIELRELTALLLRFVAVYVLFDAAYTIFSAAMKGAGDMRFVLTASLLLAMVAPVLTWIGVVWFGAGILWAWASLTIWVLLLGVVFFARFHSGAWKNKRVIEANPDELPATVEPEPVLS